jgi:FMN phosphatase YigB (HAD superfamily)
MIKPETQIFELMIDLLKIKKDEGIFIDDRQKNVDAGNKFGIKSLLYINNEELTKDLKKIDNEIQNNKNFIK